MFQLIKQNSVGTLWLLQENDFSITSCKLVVTFLSEFIIFTINVRMVPNILNIVYTCLNVTKINISTFRTIYTFFFNLGS